MIFNLDRYYKSSKRKYVFIDYIINLDKTDKLSLFRKFGISYDSFRVEKCREKVNNDNVDRLLDFYGFHPVNPFKIKEYEKCINHMYYAVYFRELDRIQESIEELNAYIKENNYLKPLFRMFKVYGYMNISSSIDDSRYIINMDLDYISKFRKEYFVDEFELIYESILISYNLERDFSKVSNLSLKYPKLSWIYLFARGSVYYTKKQNDKAYRCFKMLEEEFETNRNSERLMLVYSNLCYIHNELEEYFSCIDLSKKSIEYIYSSTQSIWVSNILMHYLFANFMLSRYKDIIDFYTEEIFNISRLNWVAASLCILSSFLNKELDKSLVIIERFKNDSSVALIIEYINTGNKQVLYKLKQIPYIVKIINKLP